MNVSLSFDQILGLIHSFLPVQQHHYDIFQHRYKLALSQDQLLNEVEFYFLYVDTKLLLKNKLSGHWQVLRREDWKIQLNYCNERKWRNRRILQEVRLRAQRHSLFRWENTHNSSRYGKMRNIEKKWIHGRRLFRVLSAIKTVARMSEQDGGGGGSGTVTHKIAFFLFLVNSK